ncbi:MAG: glycosyltransferase, partial [Acutalibacteraceae bacterium]
FRYSEEKRNEIRKKFGFTDEIVLGHVGRFDEYKNQGFLLDVLNEIRNCGVNAKLLLLGDGNLRQAVESKTDSLGISDSVIFAGVVPDVYNYLNAMDVFVFPSIYEGLPLTLIEAQANGLHVFASDAVSDESDVTGRIDFLPLSSGAEKWAEKIKEKLPYDRDDTVQLIKNAGYDALSSAKQLESFYLEKASKL